MVGPSPISVVIPTYNRAHLVCAAIDSALGQTHANLEVLVVDDGSTDGTMELLARTYGRDPRVRALPQTHQGVSEARNHGLREAKGEYLALLDSDDVWLPWKIEAQLRCLDALPAAGMIWTDMAAVDLAGKVVSPRYLTKMYGAYARFGRDELFDRSFPFSELDPVLAETLSGPRVYAGDIFSPMIVGNLVHTSTVLLRRERFERVKGFDTALRRSGEDYDFHLRTCREGAVAYLDVASIHCQTEAPDRLTGPAYRLDMARNFLATIAPILERDIDRIRLPRETIDEVLANAHGWLGKRLYENGENRAAAAHLAASLRRRPKQPRIAALLALSLLPPGVSGRTHEAWLSVKRRIQKHP